MENKRGDGGRERHTEQPQTLTENWMTNCIGFVNLTTGRSDRGPWHQLATLCPPNRSDTSPVMLANVKQSRFSPLSPMVCGVLVKSRRRHIVRLETLQTVCYRYLFEDIDLLWFLSVSVGVWARPDGRPQMSPQRGSLTGHVKIKFSWHCFKFSHKNHIFKAEVHRSHRTSSHSSLQNNEMQHTGLFRGEAADNKSQLLHFHCLVPEIFSFHICVLCFTECSTPAFKIIRRIVNTNRDNCSWK